MFLELTWESKLHNYMVWFLLWKLNVVDLVKYLVFSPGLSWLCVRLCNFKSPFVLQVNIQRSQDISVSSECLYRLCLFKSLPVVQEYWHDSQVNGFSPVCVLLCFFKSPLVEQLYWHDSHVNGFSPVCFLLCISNLLGVAHKYRQVSQEYFIIFSSIWANNERDNSTYCVLNRTEYLYFLYPISSFCLWQTGVIL